MKVDIVGHQEVTVTAGEGGALWGELVAGYLVEVEAAGEEVVTVLPSEHL